MSEDFITRNEHNEFVRRIDQENDRQNHRISELESTVKEISVISKNVERLAVSMENMTEEQKRQGQRLTEIESKPAKKWDNLSWLVISALATGILGYILGMVL